MTRVGVRELRQRASELLRRVESGETFEVTDRGRPVAVLGPIRTKRPVERMRASGDLERSRADMDELAQPLKLTRGQEPPSKTLERLRKHER